MTLFKRKSILHWGQNTLNDVANTEIWYHFSIGTGTRQDHFVEVGTQCGLWKKDGIEDEILCQEQASDWSKLNLWQEHTKHANHLTRYTDYRLLSQVITSIRDFIELSIYRLSKTPKGWQKMPQTWTWVSKPGLARYNCGQVKAWYCCFIAKVPDGSQVPFVSKWRNEVGVSMRERDQASVKSNEATLLVQQSWHLNGMKSSTITRHVSPSCFTQILLSVIGQLQYLCTPSECMAKENFEHFVRHQTCLYSLKCSSNLHNCRVLHIDAYDLSWMSAVLLLQWLQYWLSQKDGVRILKYGSVLPGRQTDTYLSCTRWVPSVPTLWGLQLCAHFSLIWIYKFDCACKNAGDNIIFTVIFFCPRRLECWKSKTAFLTRSSLFKV